MDTAPPQNNPQTKPQRGVGKGKILALTALLAVVGIVLIGMMISLLKGESRPDRPGHKGHLSRRDGGTVVVFVSREALGDFELALEHNDLEAGRQILRSARAFPMDDKSRVEILDHSSEGIATVRILAGEHAGQTMYVRSSYTVED